MIRTCQSGALTYLTSDRLAGTVHCFSTRLGGVSTGHLASLNLGTTRGDAPQNVRKNYELLGRAVGFDPRSTVFTRQIHTDLVRAVTRADRGHGLFRPADYQCDALITQDPGVALCCFSADCVPVLLYAPDVQAIAAIHAGWRGTALGIVYKAALALAEQFGADPAALRAAIGPCISACCFETEGDVPTAMRAALGSDADGCITGGGPKYHVDLKELNRRWLLRVGVDAHQIDVAPHCTACDCNTFWSHRRLGEARGVQAGIIMLGETP